MNRVCNHSFRIRVSLLKTTNGLHGQKRWAFAFTNPLKPDKLQQFELLIQEHCSHSQQAVQLLRALIDKKSGSEKTKLHKHFSEFMGALFGNRPL